MAGGMGVVPHVAKEVELWTVKAWAATQVNVKQGLVTLLVSDSTAGIVMSPELVSGTTGRADQGARGDGR